jgi:hypothetical protein
MRRIQLYVFLGLWLAAASLVASQERSADTLAAARAATEKNMQTAEGRQYDIVVSEEFPEKYQESLQRCTSSAAEKDLASFQIFAKVAEDGTITRVLVSPETKVALCLRRDLLKGRFSPPPKPGFWIKVEMNMMN